MKFTSQLPKSIRGKALNAVFYEAFGKQIARTRPFKYNRPDSSERDFQEDKFAFCVHHLRPALEFVRLGFSRYPHAKTSWNGAMSMNMLNLSSVPPTLLQDAIDAIEWSWGSLPNDPEPVNFVQNITHTNIYHFPSAQQLIERPNDFRMCFVLAPSTGIIFRPVELTARQDSVVQIPRLFNGFGHPCYYIYFYADQNLNEFSTSEIQQVIY